MTSYNAKHISTATVSSSQTSPLQPKQILSFFSSQMEDKLLFQKQKWFVAATHKLMRHLQSATASQRDEATKEEVSLESRNETSQKYHRFPKLGYMQNIFNKDTYLFTQIQSLLLKDAKSQLGNTELYRK